MKKTLLAVLIGSLVSASAQAFEPFTVKDIRVEGIQRTEAGTVFSYLPVKVGDTMNDEKAANAIKSLFATGFFKDVRVEIDGNVLVVVVQERPAIAKIDFVGMKEFEKDKIEKALKESGVAEGRIFDRSALEKSEQELKRQYLARGRYGATITTTVTPLERNRVGINFTIDEGQAAKIRQINVVGAKAFSEKELQSLFELSTPGWLTWYNKNDQYSRQKLSADLEKLSSFYLNRGYLEFGVESTQVSISPDKQDVYITVNIHEGERYQVSSVKLAGDLVVPEAELRQLFKVKPGEAFSREKLNESTKAISERLGKEGYAFANVNAAPELDKEKRQVAFTVFVDPGKRVYVRRVNVTGNTKTRDEVVRREMRQMEGGWYDAEKVTLSKQRIDKTELFKDVTVETPAVPGTADQIDVNVNVEEKPNGNLMVGAGFSSSEKIVLSGSISQNNIFGSGKNVSAQLSNSKINRVYSLSYTDPYFTVDGISQGFDIYHRNVNPTGLDVGWYKSSSTGGGVRWGFPIGEKESITVGVAVDSTTLTVNRPPDLPSSPQRYIQFVDRYGKSNLTIPISLGWASDSKDSFIYPTQGTLHRASFELSIPGSDLKYYRATYQLQHFVPMTKNLTLALNGELGIGNGYGGQDLPFYKNFYAGGINSVRGYATSSLGRRDCIGNPCVETDDRLGGNRRIIGNAELLFGVPGFDKSVRLGAFFDIGQVFAAGDKISMGEFRYSSGLSIAWISPLGPLKFSLAQPLNKKPGDKAERFQFQMGTTF
ncbi:MAG: outer membrane protein assembly factor BamA [Betaproteobacteria bacterium]